MRSEVTVISAVWVVMPIMNEEWASTQYNEWRDPAKTQPALLVVQGWSGLLNLAEIGKRVVQSKEHVQQTYTRYCYQ